MNGILLKLLTFQDVEVEKLLPELPVKKEYYGKYYNKQDNEEERIKQSIKVNDTMRVEADIFLVSSARHC